MNVLLTQEQANFIKLHSSCIDGKWHYLPFWFHEIGDNTFELVNFEDLPNHVKELIEEHRNPK